jgi:predicted RNA-binding protein with RPS1 domain
MPKKTEPIETTDGNAAGTNVEENMKISLAENMAENANETAFEQQSLNDESTAPPGNPELDDFISDAETPENNEQNQFEPEDPDQTPETENESQSEGETPEPVKRTRRTRKTTGTPESESQSDNTDAPAPRRRRARATKIVSIDESRSVETSADRHNNELLDLVESLKSKKILSGTIQGVERSADNPNLSYAVIYHGDFKIIIPAEELVEPPADFRDRSPGDVMHYMVTKRLGAEIDYIVKGVDKTGIAAASRLEAMAAKRKEYYFGTDRDGNNLLYEGINAEARVVSVIRAGIFVDLFGVETYIALRELSYQRGVDAAAQFQPGQRVLVKVLSIDKSNRNKIQVTASVKQATENPYEKALRKYVPGSRYVGTVSMVDTNGVFVSLDGGIDCLCSYPKRGRPPRGSRVTVRIIGINHDTNRIWGAITHMTTAR